MNYRTDRHGAALSQLGYGCMRFSRKGGGLDYAKAERELLLAVEGGVNYFDTAYIYPGSEELLGRVLEANGCRDRVNIATKLPHYLMKSRRAIDRTFAEELARLRTDRIDYYLMHMFTAASEWERLRAFGIEDWIAQRKAEGSIRSIGFSYHGDTEQFRKLLEVYDWDFCMIQYNYLDENSQAGRAGLRAAAAKGIPVMVMEPLRGGSLARLPEKAMAALAESGRGYTPAELGLRWVLDQPEVCCVLSGMNSEEMVRENLRIASDMTPGAFTAADRALVERVRDIFREKERIGCTGCRYCMPCPKGVDIPGVFHCWNMMYMEEKKSAGRSAYCFTFGMRSEPGFASQCVGCGRCEAHCPQRLPIREKLREAERELRPLPYRIATAVARKTMSR